MKLKTFMYDEAEGPEPETPDGCVGIVFEAALEARIIQEEFWSQTVWPKGELPLAKLMELFGIRSGSPMTRDYDMPNVMEERPIRARLALERGPLDMTEAEVEAYFSGALAAVPGLLTDQLMLGNPRRYYCDDRDLHLIVTLDVEADRYANFTWAIRVNSGVGWKFSF